ncbi:MULTISPECIES: hypothetical protein [unclassified Streptomyces]|uniref:hypothetical protein n=1 Tax=unclassified Streptomyces TaxID=2593676 RepID=UPI0037F821ED
MDKLSADRPRSFSQLPRTPLAAFTAIVAAGILAAPATAAPRAAVAAAGRTALECHVATTPDHPVTFSPALTLRPRTIRMTATFRLTGCSSPAGTERRLRTGVLTVQGRGNASCTGGTQLSGSAAVTWYDSAGHKSGTSTIKSTRSSVSGYNPTDALFGGEVVSGSLAGTKVSGSATPTSDVTPCASSGLRTLHGAGTLSFKR